MVVAKSRDVVEGAAALVGVVLEPLPAVSDCAAAMMPGSPVAHAGSSSNIAARVPITVGNADAAFAGAAHAVRERLFIHRGGPFFMECRGVAASPDAVAASHTGYVSYPRSQRI